ncbi:hypothetical protein HYU13_03780 [Candidatus Woesearchaeota archaeon]|nr:hypothetical protein [Candidatus Woesearchaeota archaeon]
MRYTLLVIISLLLVAGCSQQDSFKGDSSGEAIEATGNSFEDSLQASGQPLGNSQDGSIQQDSVQAEEASKLELLEPGSVEAEPQQEIPSISEGQAISIYKTKFSADDISIGMGTKVTWMVADGRRHIVSCYKDGKRQFQSKELYAENKFSHEFSQAGTFTCVDSIYGHRGMIRVSQEMGKGMAAPTGYAINIPQGASEPSYFVMLLILAGISSAVFFSSKRKR